MIWWDSSEGKKLQICASAGRGGIPKKRRRILSASSSSVLLFSFLLLSFTTNSMAVAWKVVPTSLTTALASSAVFVSDADRQAPLTGADAADTKQNTAAKKSSSSSPIRRRRLKRKNLLQKTLIPEPTSSVISPLVVPEPPRTRIAQKGNNHLFVVLCCLATLTGISEAICFRRFGAFPNMMTGNTVRLCSFVSTGEYSKATFPLSLIVSYVLGGALYQTIQIQQQQSTSTSAPLLLYKVSKLAFGFFVLSDIMAFLTKSPRSSSLWLMSIAHGMINAATVAQLKTVTNAVTGHWQSIGIGLGDLISKNKQISKSSKTSTLIVSCFVTSLLITGWIMNWMIANSKSILSTMIAKLPFATSFGGAYLLLFSWYHKSTTKKKESLLL